METSLCDVSQRKKTTGYCSGQVGSGEWWVLENLGVCLLAISLPSFVPVAFTVIKRRRSIFNLCLWRTINHVCSALRCSPTMQIWVWLVRVLLLLTEPPNNLTFPVAKAFSPDDLNVWNLSRHSWKIQGLLLTPESLHWEDLLHASQTCVLNPQATSVLYLFPSQSYVLYSPSLIVNRSGRGSCLAAQQWQKQDMWIIQSVFEAQGSCWRLQVFLH